MGISNTIPPSRLIQPGVVANTAARPTSPFTGQAIYQVDTNQMLIWNGTAWVIPNTPAQNPTGLELVTTATCSSGGTASGGVITIGSAVSSVVITNAFSATYDNYRIIISGTVVSSVGSSAFMTINGSTGATYSANGFYMAPSSGTLNGYSQNQTSAGFWLGVTGGTSSISLDIMNPFLAKATNVVGQSASSTGAGYYNTFMGADSNAASSTGFTFVQVTSNLTGGTIRIYGYRN